MKSIFRILPLALAIVLLLFGFPPRLAAQTPTPTGTAHGNMVTWNAPSPAGGSGIIQGYYLFRCLGTCTLSSTWTNVGGLLTGTSYLDSNIGTNAPQLNTTYSYAVLVVDSNGAQSGFSNIAGVTVGSAWLSNPNGATGCNAKVT